MTNFWHRSSGDLNDVLIDPAEDWSQVWWSRDHFPSRELIFNRFPRPNFEIAAVGRSAGSWPASWESGFSKNHKKLIWTYQPVQFFLQNTVLDSKLAQNRPRTPFWPISEKIDLSCRTKYGHETLNNLRSMSARLGIQDCTQKTKSYMVSDRFW